MRKDMSKVIVERERVKGVYGKTVDPFAYRFVPNQGWSEDDDDDIRHESMSLKRQHKVAGNYKRLNENLAPLKRFLQSRVGSKWNDVYSEIRSNININSAVQLHILQHVSHYVKTAEEVTDGLYRWYPFFVDEKGILCKTKYNKRQKMSVLPSVSEHLVYGYEVKVDKFNRYPVYAKLRDIWFRVSWGGELFDVYDRDGTWASLCKHDWKYNEFDLILKESRQEVKRYGGVPSIFPKESTKREYTTSIRGVDGEYVPYKYSFTTQITLKPYFHSISKKELRDLKRTLARREETKVL